VLIPLALLYFHRYQNQREISAQRYERSIQTFAGQVNEVVQNVLQGFDRTRSRPSLAEILEAGTPTASAFWIRQLSIGDDDESLSGSLDCPLQLSLQGELTFEAEGSSQNAQRTFENWRMILASDLARQLAFYAKGLTDRHPFDALLVTDQGGNVFLFQGNDEGRPARSQILPLLQEGANTKSDKGTIVKEVVNEPISFAGRSYLVFHREIQSYATEAARRLTDKKECQTPLSFHAIGLVSADAPRQAGLQLTREPLVILLLLAVFGLLSFPFLKLFLLPVGERFRRADALLLLACGALLFTVLTYLLLLGASQASLHEREDADLHEMADLLRGHFAEESRMALHQLDALLTISWDVKANKEKNRVLYPDLDDALCPQPAGRQIRWHHEGENLVPSMESIETSMEDSGLEGLNVSDSCAPAVSGPQQSWPTGDRITRFEGRGPTQEDCVRRVEAPWTIFPRCALFAHTRSLEKAILPEHFGFAVLDKSGKVLYHSDHWRAGFENFANEIGRHDWLLGGDSEPTTLSYHGEDQRVLVTPFRRNWYLAVFHDQDAFRAIRLYTGLFVLVLSMVYVLVLAGLASLFLLLFPALRVPCYWRRADEGDLYRRLAILFAVIVSLTVWHISKLPPWAAVLMGGMAAAETFLLTLVVLARRTRSMDPPCSPPAGSIRQAHPVLLVLAAIAVIALLWAIGALTSVGSWPALSLLLVIPLALAIVVLRTRRSAPSSGSSQASFSIAFTLLLLLVGGLPGYAFYRAAFQEETRALALRLQSQALEALTRAEAPSILSKELSLIFPGVTRTFSAEDPSTSTFSATWFDHLYSDFREQMAPRLWTAYTDKTSRALRAPGRGDSDGFKAECRIDPKSELVCALPSDWLSGLVLRSELPALLPLSQLAITLVAGLILLVSAWALIDRSAAWLLVTAETGTAESLAGLRMARILWLAPPGSWQELAAEGSEKVVLGLADLLQLAEAGPADLHSLAGKTVVVKGFGRDPGDLELNRRRIAALRALMNAEPQGIWLLSEVSPLEMARPSEERSEALNDLLEEWFVLRHPRSAVENVRRLSRSNPETIWRSLTGEERRVSQQVAAGGLLRLGEAGRALIEYGVLKADPQPHVCDPSFERFLLHRATVEKPGPTAAGVQIWPMTRTVLLLSLTVVLGFLLFTQAEAFQLLSGAITSLAVVLAAVSQLGHLLRPSPSSNGS